MEWVHAFCGSDLVHYVWSSGGCLRRCVFVYAGRSSLAEIVPCSGCGFAPSIEPASRARRDPSVALDDAGRKQAATYCRLAPFNLPCRRSSRLAMVVRRHHRGAPLPSRLEGRRRFVTLLVSFGVILCLVAAQPQPQPPLVCLSLRVSARSLFYCIVLCCTVSLFFCTVSLYYRRSSHVHPCSGRPGRMSRSGEKLRSGACDTARRGRRSG